MTKHVRCGNRTVEVPEVVGFSDRHNTLAAEFYIHWIPELDLYLRFTAEMDVDTFWGTIPNLDDPDEELRLAKEIQVPIDDPRLVWSVTVDNDAAVFKVARHEALSLGALMGVVRSKLRDTLILPSLG